MAAGWDTTNESSRRLHERVGFEIVGKRPDEEGKVGTVIAIWQGAGRAKKEDTIYRDNPDFA
jgi:L-amino acid N-acyltransferase YncA